MPHEKNKDGTYSYYNDASNFWTTENDGIRMRWNYENNILKCYTRLGSNWDELFTLYREFKTENELKQYTKSYVVPEDSDEYSDGGRKPRRPPPTRRRKSRRRKPTRRRRR